MLTAKQIEVLLFLSQNGKTEWGEIADNVSSKMPLETLKSLVKRKLVKKSSKKVDTYNIFNQPIKSENIYYELTKQGKRLTNWIGD